MQKAMVVNLEGDGGRRDGVLGIELNWQVCRTQPAENPTRRKTLLKYSKYSIDKQNLKIVYARDLVLAAAISDPI